jgi:hypothetical protein
MSAFHGLSFGKMRHPLVLVPVAGEGAGRGRVVDTVGATAVVVEVVATTVVEVVAVVVVVLLLLVTVASEGPLPP